MTDIQQDKAAFGKVMLLIGVAIFAIAMIGGSISDEKQSSDAKPATLADVTAQTQDSRPNVAPPLFKVVHQDSRTITIVTKADATDDEIKSILWRLRDLMRSHSFSGLGLNNKFLQKTDYKVGMFEVYRGTKCAPESFSARNHPCGKGNHEAGWYMWGNLFDPNKDAAEINDSNGKETEVWNPDDEYSVPEGMRGKLEEESRLAAANEQADRPMQEALAMQLNHAVWDGGYHASFFQAPTLENLWLSQKCSIKMNPEQSCWQLCVPKNKSSALSALERSL